MELAIYIKKLLYNNNSVIISGLGTLRKIYKPAEINSSQNIITPPSQTLAFDGSNKVSDSSLEKFIASQQGISKKNAEKLISKNITSINTKLEAGETLFWEGIGYFSKNNGEIRFEPEQNANFLTDSFGLSAIDYKPIELNLAAKPSEVIYKQRNYTVLYVILAIVVVIGACVALYFYNPDLVNRFKATAQITSVKQQPNNAESLASATKDTTKHSELEQVVDKSTDKKNALAPKTTNTSPAQTEKALYYIIAGSFKTYERATILAKQWKKEGYKPEVMQFDRELFRVSLGEFKDKPTALQELDRIKNCKGPEAVWLLTKKM